MHWLEFITCSWVVVIPWGSSNSTATRKMELFIYPDLQVQQNVIGELFGSIMTWISLFVEIYSLFCCQNLLWNCMMMREITTVWLAWSQVWLKK